MKTKNVGLVLSGGGHKAAAHIGAIKALEEHGYYPNYISGVSAGAIIAALYAKNYSVQEMLDFLKNTSFFKISKIAIKKPGLLDSNKFHNLLKKVFPEDNFSALSKKIFITTTDLIHAKEKMFDQGELILPLLASAAFPGIFTPVIFHNNVFADGGILNNFPIEYLPKTCEKVFGIYVSPIKNVQPSDFKYSVNVMDRALDLTRFYLSAKKFNQCDLLINPSELSKFGIFESNEIDKIFEIGYQTTKAKLIENNL